MRNLTRIVRLIRQRRATERPAVPLGTVGMLMQLDETAGRARGCHAKELAERAGLDPSTVSRSVTALVSQGLVARRSDPADRRASFLALTDTGRAALDEARAWYGDLIGHALANWTPTEIEAFSAALDRFATDIEAALDRSATPAPPARPDGFDGTAAPPARPDGLDGSGPDDSQNRNDSQNKLEAAR